MNPVVRQIMWAFGGAVIGATCWVLLSIPSHLINVIFSTLVGLGAGLGAGRLSGLARSARGVGLALVATVVVGLAGQALITRSYLTWAHDNLGGVPDSARWDGPVGALRLVFDRAGASHGWAPNASYGWWIISLVVAALAAWLSAASGGSALQRVHRA